jgi:hypothetical protein
MPSAPLRVGDDPTLDHPPNHMHGPENAIVEAYAEMRARRARHE